MDTITHAHHWSRALGSKPGATLRLFCFSYAGGGVSVFRDWPRHLALPVEVCPVLLPGHEYRSSEPLSTNMPSLVSGAVEALLPYLSTPYVLFGHSLGALIAFEFARQVRRVGGPHPEHLFASASPAPHVHRHPCRRLHKLPDDVLLERLREFDGTPETILEDTELMRFFLPILRADFALEETYIYRPDVPLRCPISVFGGSDDAMVDRDSLLAWQYLTSSSFRLHLLPGGHFFIRTVPGILLATISQDLLPVLRS